MKKNLLIFCEIIRTYNRLRNVINDCETDNIDDIQDEKERDDISFYLAQGKGDSEIGLILHRNRSTIWREQKRNKPQVNEVRYLGNRADIKAKERWKISHQRKRLSNNRLRSHVETKIKKGFPF